MKALIVCAVLTIALAVGSSADAASQTAPTPSQAIVTLQQDLRVLGFSPGPIDGIVGVATAAAVKKYAANNGIVWSNATMLPILKLIMLDARILRARQGQDRAEPGGGGTMQHIPHKTRSW